MYIYTLSLIRNCISFQSEKVPHTRKEMQFRYVHLCQSDSISSTNVICIHTHFDAFRRVNLTVPKWVQQVYLLCTLTSFN